MWLKKIKLIAVVAMAMIVGYAGAVCATQIPYDHSNVKYFYVFGAQGDPLMGAEDNMLEIVIDVPAAQTGGLVIGIWDPDTGGKIDWKKPGNKWNTETEFAVYGKDLLDKKTFGEDPRYDKETYYFGPFSPEKGEKTGDKYRFRLVVKGLSGDDENLFKVFITPDSAESFSRNLTFRLLPHQGQQMFFYPEVPAGTDTVIVENYDLDVNGGTSTISLTEITKKFKIADSKSGQWSMTRVPLNIEKKGRLVYIITKATQRYANAGLKITDAEGNALPIYFQEGPPPVTAKPVEVPMKPRKKVPETKCNKFTFDATSSYDVDDQELSYLWDFGDGTTSTEPVVTHTYDKAGEYNVKLTVTDSSGLPCDSGVTTRKVYVNTPPVAAFSAPEKVCLEREVTFDAGATTDDTPGSLTYTWDFGDGSGGQGREVTHMFDRGGMYVVSLTVDDNSGTECDLDSVQKTIHVNTAPSADAGRDKNLCLDSLDKKYTVVFDADGSRDPDGDTLEYRWDFGDGNSAIGERVTHIYEKGGNYTAKLTVDDGHGLPCSMASDTVSVKLNKTPLAVAGPAQKACVGETVTFDGTASRTEAGEQLTYAWDLGDGTNVTGANVKHTYDEGGKYTVLLTVDDGRGTDCSTSSAVTYIDVNSPPSARIEDVGVTCVGNKVSFDASASNDPDGDVIKYMWDLGDGTRKEGYSRESHIYDEGGTYTVKLTVNDGSGSKCSVDTATTVVKVNTPPSAMMSVDEACCVDMEQKFDASASNDPDGDKLSYSWDFGDGTTARGVKVTHVYTEPGIYKVILYVDDGSGTECATDVISDTINVNAKPVPVIEVR